MIGSSIKRRRTETVTCSFSFARSASSAALRVSSAERKAAISRGMESAADVRRDTEETRPTDDRG